MQLLFMRLSSNNQYDCNVGLLRGCPSGQLDPYISPNNYQIGYA